ncbi:hypothetical protein MMYC01_204080 [Madurella mycetomatis]|uniref:Chromo domain-containing protein n=1 Tax=Madurella mycetomatis TaxID=100816 RepID=A0A175WCB6_9PEZI|nr:hypothetical protein MMYC01_204080 [Madurella mycetomatis]
MALRFQAYNPETRKFDQPPGSIPRSKKPSSNKPRYDTQAVPISVVKDDGKSLLHPGPPSTPEANGDDQGSETVGSRAIAGNSQMEPPCARDSGGLCKDIDETPSGSAGNTPGSAIGEYSDVVESPHDGSIRSTQRIHDAEGHSPENEGLKALESFPYTDSTLTDHMELGSAEAPDGPDLHGQESEGQGEADLGSLDNPETALTGKDDALPPDQWKVKKIIGEEVMGGVRYYLVDWAPTLEPASNVSKDLIREWKDQKAKMQAPGMKRNRGSKTKKITDQGEVEKCRGGPRRG